MYLCDVSYRVDASSGIDWAVYSCLLLHSVPCHMSYHTTDQSKVSPILDRSVGDGVIPVYRQMTY